jgi:hypothetical protein
MSNSLTYTTISSNEEVLRQLYTVGDTEYFPCMVRVAIRRSDCVEDAEAKLYIKRKANASADFIHANGDKIYKTVARLEPEGRDVNVDVTIHTRGSTVYYEEGATVSMDNTVRSVSDEITLDRFE